MLFGLPYTYVIHYSQYLSSQSSDRHR